MRKPALIFFSALFLFLAAPAKAQAASFELSPQSLTINKDAEFNINLYLNTGGKLINAIDSLLNFPTNLLEVKDISFSSRFPTNIKSYNNSTGKIEIHSAAFSVSDISSSNGTVATIKFKTKAEGTTSVYFTCNPGQTTDSNILESGTSNDIIDCNANKGGEYKIQEGASPTPSPTPSSCKAPIDPTQLTGKPGSNAGQVILTWSKILNADYYTISYGLLSRNYIYGVPNTGNSDQYTISKLSPGRIYYFAITAVNDCGSSGHSNEVAVRAKQETIIITTTPIPEPLPSPNLSPTPSATSSASPSVEPTPVEEPEETPTPPPQAQASPIRDLLKYAGIGLIIFIIILATIKTLTQGSGSKISGVKENETEESEGSELPPPFPDSQMQA
jgi:hypothetical protein